jgi:SAM-dependent methyltransferase
LVRCSANSSVLLVVEVAELGVAEDVGTQSSTAIPAALLMDSLCRPGSSYPSPLKCGRMFTMAPEKLYTEIAEWWPLLSDPADYAEEGEIYRNAIVSHSKRVPKTMLELGSGGGNNASHLKAHFVMTLVDLSPNMLKVSRALNPQCDHLQGDMRTFRLNQTFDVVFIHDAISYMNTRADLRAAVTTAFVHCRPGGVALFVPDHTSESYSPATSHGGNDHGARGLRYLEWTLDVEPKEDSYRSIMVYALREPSGAVKTVTDVHVHGLFPEAVWLDLIADVGFQPRSVAFDHSELEPGLHRMFIAVKPDNRD